MSLFKILKGDSSRISMDKTPFHDGWCFYTSNDGGFYIDSEDGGVQKRTRINEKGVTSFNGRTGAVTPQTGDYTAAQVGAVPKTRKVNGKTLSADVTLSATDVGARPNTWTPTASDVGAAAANHSHSNYASSTHTHTAADVGAATASHTHTAADVGAAPANHGTHVSYSTTAPKANGTATAGTAGTVARSDHVHPTDTSRAPVTHTHSKSQITDFPQSLPASDVSAWAKAKTKPTYTASEVGARPSSWTPTAADVGASPSDHTHTAADVGAAEANHSHSEYATTSHSHTAAQVGAVPTSRKINNKALSADVSLSASDVGAAAANHSHSGYAAASHSHSYLPLAGGTLTGNLTLKGSGNYGTQINLGDGDYVHISEPIDDCMEIKAKKLNIVLSDTSTEKLTINGTAFLSAIGGVSSTEIGDIKAILDSINGESV